MPLQEKATRWAGDLESWQAPKWHAPDSVAALIASMAAMQQGPDIDKEIDRIDGNDNGVGEKGNDTAGQPAMTPSAIMSAVNSMRWPAMAPSSVLHATAPQKNDSPPPGFANPDGFVELSLHTGEGGNYFTAAQINGHAVNVMVDTGASFVSIPESLQAKLELPMGRPMTFTTASDKYPSHGTTIHSLVLGPIQLKDIDGDLNPRSPDGRILLGMSALKNLEMAQKGNTLTLRAPASMAAYAANGGSHAAKPLLIMKRSVRECMGKGNMIDERALKCIQGE